MKPLITGATGFVGKRLVARLPDSVVLSRDVHRARTILGGANVYPWNPEREPPPAEAFRGVDAVFHLAGESVANGRWTAAKKQRILDSRVQSTRNLVEAIAKLGPRPQTLVCASAVGWYGSRGDEILDERSLPGAGFLADVCQQWEQEAARARDQGVRVVSVRIGLVLGRDGGALQKMLLPFKLCVGGRLASGRQWMPWIHVEDLVGLMLFTAEHATLEGPVNGTAPAPVTNQEFTRTLAGALHRPAFLPAPEFALKLALGEMSELLLSSQRAIPRAAQEAGFQFRFSRLEDALADIVGSAAVVT